VHVVARKPNERAPGQDLSCGFHLRRAARPFDQHGRAFLPVKSRAKVFRARSGDTRVRPCKIAPRLQLVQDFRAGLRRGAIARRQRSAARARVTKRPFSALPRPACRHARIDPRVAIEAFRDRERLARRAPASGAVASSQASSFSSAG
jgi:hypothetical protein